MNKIMVQANMVRANMVQADMVHADMVQADKYYNDKLYWKRSLVFNPLHYSVFIVPAIAYPIVIITGKYSLFITLVPLTCSSILYHHDFKIKNIRNYDIILSWTTTTHQLVYNFLYAKDYLFIYFYLYPAFFYFLAKLFQKYGCFSYSIYMHTYMHFSLILCIAITTGIF